MISPAIDLRRSLRSAFGTGANTPEVIRNADRQRSTAKEILKRFFEGDERCRREILLLADEVGLGKTYVALTVAVSVLDAIRRGQAPDDLPQNQPTVLILTPNSKALFQKWQREAKTFRSDCARTKHSLDWLDVEVPRMNGRSGNVVDLAEKILGATRRRPRIVIAKLGAFGAALSERHFWRKLALSAIFRRYGIRGADRKAMIRSAFGSGSRKVAGELRDLRSGQQLWNEALAVFSRSPRAAYDAAVAERGELVTAAIASRGTALERELDDITRTAIARAWPNLPLVIIDEIHNLKNPKTTTRHDLQMVLKKGPCRLLGLSATPFQLRHDELIQVLGLRTILDISGDRRMELDRRVDALTGVMKSSRETGTKFREAWLALQAEDSFNVARAWSSLQRRHTRDWAGILARESPRVRRAFEAEDALLSAKGALERELRPFVIRHRRERDYRRHWIGRDAIAYGARGSKHFAWVPGIEPRGDQELAQYLLMRAVSVAKDERGAAGLGAELTGSYRHLVNTSAIWRHLEGSRNTDLPKYTKVLRGLVGETDSDLAHPKIEATAERVLRAFMKGQKSLIFCVHVATAEAVRDVVRRKVDRWLGEERDRVFGTEQAFEGFRKRFFQRRESLYSLIQDHPLLGSGGRAKTMRQRIGLRSKHLDDVIGFLLDRGEDPGVEKPDRRLLLAAVEHVATKYWLDTQAGSEWLKEALGQSCPELTEEMSSPRWLSGRPALSKAPRRGDPEARRGHADPLGIEDARGDGSRRRRTGDPLERWRERLRKEAIGEVIAPYFQPDVLGRRGELRMPLLPDHHGHVLARLDIETRKIAGQVFRRVLMADEFLLRFLTATPKDERAWAPFLARRYEQVLEGQRESLASRVGAYLDVLVRAGDNQDLLAGYHDAATNMNVVQMVHGGMDVDRYFLGFNTPYRPEILITTAVGQEGIDLHRECRHVVHHDLCWNPATLEQRTGRVDRIGSKVERERLEVEEEPVHLDVAVPYLAATYDERMFEELHRRAQLFEVTMGGDFRVEGRVSEDEAKATARARKRQGIGTPDEELGDEGYSGAIDLPGELVSQLRINLAV